MKQFFSGDFDTVCPLPATRYSIRDLKLRITTPWRPWTVNMEVSSIHLRSIYVFVCV